MMEPDEPPPFEVVNPDGQGRVLLLCDHASHRIPRRLGTLGLRPEQTLEHIGWDIGAASVARRLSSLLDAPLVLSGYSRLVIDCNRPPQADSSIPAVTCGVPVPGNEGLTEHERRRRREAFFDPYHGAIDALMQRRERPSVLLSIHSFTPDYPGQHRPWPVAILYRKYADLAARWMHELRTTHGLVVGDNEPYRVTSTTDYSVPVHGEDRDIPALLIEIRQDGVASAEGALAWADRLASVARSVAISPAAPG